VKKKTEILRLNQFKKRRINMKKWQKIAMVVGGGALVCTGVGVVAAGPIACLLGSTGLLGAASTGTAISSLTGVALTNASLAAIGGGAVAAGGAGVAAGTAVVGGAVGLTGAAVSGAVAGRLSKDDDDDDKEEDGQPAKL
jgi:hypothetical protein